MASPIATSAFNRLWPVYQQSWSQGLLLHRARRFFIAVAKTIASTHLLPTHGGMARLSIGLGGLVKHRYGILETNALQLSQTAIEARPLLT